MKILSHTRSLVFSGALLLIAAGSAAANVLMLDFGPITVTGTDQSNSPYHTVDSEYTGTSWNKVQTADVTSGVFWGDGSAADGVTLNLGRSSTLNQAVLTFAGAPVSIEMGTDTNTGVFSGTSVGRDGISYDVVVGIAIGGLGAGTYDIYVTGANTNRAPTFGATIGFWGMSTASTASIDTTPYVDSPDGTSTNSVVGSWIEGSNYVKLTVTLSEADPYLVIFATGVTENENRGFLNSIQVVSVPEPAETGAALGVIVLGLAVLARRVRRFRR
ncbi:MAG: hypothetical protein Q7Q73_06660 [Verrucomicrobiota bacterium JB024]|nr:hypothetical protein [Verrucomicrobiota bacterium JB024]